MDDNELIGYCDIHSETERALFHGKHVNRMLELAGRDERVPEEQFYSLHDEMKELVRAARALRRNSQ